MRKVILIPTALIAALALAGCASLGGYGYGTSRRGESTYPNSADIYTPGQAQTITRVVTGTVIAIQPVTIRASNGVNAMGEGLGAAAGGLLGHQVGHGSGKTLATVAGAVAGALGGHELATSHYRQKALQITIRLDHHAGTIAVTQDTGPAVKVGERVEVIGGQGRQPARVEPLHG